MVVKLGFHCQGNTDLATNPFKTWILTNMNLGSKQQQYGFPTAKQIGNCRIDVNTQQMGLKAIQTIAPELQKADWDPGICLTNGERNAC